MESTRQALLNNLIIDIDKRKNIYQKLMYKFKKYDDISEAVITGLGVAATSCLIIGLSHMNPIILITGTVLGAFGTIMSGIKRVLNIQQKYENCRTTYLNLNELSLEIKIVVVRNGLTNDQKQDLLITISNKLNLIDDTAPPVSSQSLHKN